MYELEDDQNADEEADVAHAGHEKGFARSPGCFGFFKPETDEEERRQADEFPKDERLQEIDGIDKAEHGPGKETEQCKIARFARVVRHVAD